MKPAWEVILVFRKPLSEPSVARNVLKHGTGAINVDGCRVATTPKDAAGRESRNGSTARNTTGYMEGWTERDKPRTNIGAGRFPSNVLLSHVPPDENGEGGCVPVGRKKVRSNDRPNVAGQNGNGKRPYEGGFEPLKKSTNGHADPDGFEEVQAYECARDEEGRLLCPVALLDQQSGIGDSRPGKTNHAEGKTHTYGWAKGGIYKKGAYHSDAGGSSRFFKVFDGEPPFRYQSKASRKDRGEGNTHSTVKPTALMRYLVRLVTPAEGVILDPFAGSGTTGVAAIEEGLRSLLVEKEPDYAEIAATRLSRAEGCATQDAFDLGDAS